MFGAPQLALSSPLARPKVALDLRRHCRARGPLPARFRPPECSSCQLAECLSWGRARRTLTCCGSASHSEGAQLGASLSGQPAEHVQLAAGHFRRPFEWLAPMPIALELSEGPEVGGAHVRLWGAVGGLEVVVFSCFSMLFRAFSWFFVPFSCISVQLFRPKLARFCPILPDFMPFMHHQLALNAKSCQLLPLANTRNN